MNYLNRTKILIVLFVLVFLYWLFFECNKNVVYVDKIAFAMLIHAWAIYKSLDYFKYIKIPLVFVFSLFNILGLVLAPSNIDFKIFQLGAFNPGVYDEINLGYLLFYVTHFFFLKQQIKLNTKSFQLPQTVHGKKGVKQLLILQNFSLFFYVLSKTIEFPISGLNEFIELITIGSLMVGFFTGANSIIKNILTIILLLFTVLQILIAGLIYPLIFFGIFVLALIFIYGLKTFLSRVVVSLGVIFVLMFSILFNPVKSAYRQMDFTGKSDTDKVLSIMDLISQNNSKDINEIEEERTFFWRLTYPLSAISMVKEKTPSKVPYWVGESYFNLLYKFIPRFLWNDKPKEEMGQLFGHRYEVLDKWNLTTSMNTPIIAEAYMNFGMPGFYGIFLLMSFIMARAFISSNLKSLNNDNSLRSILSGLNVAIILTFLIQWESNFSMVFGKVIILFVVNILIEWLAFRKQNDEQIIHLQLKTTSR